MWLLKKQFPSIFLLSFYRRLKFKYILPVTLKKYIFCCSDPQYGYEIKKYKWKNYLLLSFNVMKHRLNYFLTGFQNNFLFDLNFRCELMMILTPLQWANLVILLDNNSINCLTVSNDSQFQSEDERMCEMAKEAWLKGNIVVSFIHFSCLYDKGDIIEQKKLVKIIQDLICLSVEKGGMAVVANITEHVKRFSYEKNELSVLMTLWYALFTSSLFDDNCLSNALLEDLKFKVYLEPLIPRVGANFLMHNEVGCYQRLIETSLTHNLDNAAGILLRLLFNYYYKTGYFSGCSAVYECCIELDIKLTKDQIYKYSLLKKTGVKMKRSQAIDHPKDFIFKF